MFPTNKLNKIELVRKAPGEFNSSSGSSLIRTVPTKFNSSSGSALIRTVPGDFHNSSQQELIKKDPFESSKELDKFNSDKKSVKMPPVSHGKINIGPRYKMGVQPLSKNPIPTGNEGEYYNFMTITGTGTNLLSDYSISVKKELYCAKEYAERVENQIKSINNTIDCIFNFLRSYYLESENKENGTFEKLKVPLMPFIDLNSFESKDFEHKTRAIAINLRREQDNKNDNYLNSVNKNMYSINIKLNHILNSSIEASVKDKKSFELGVYKVFMENLLYLLEKELDDFNEYNLADICERNNNIREYKIFLMKFIRLVKEKKEHYTIVKKDGSKMILSLSGFGLFLNLGLEMRSESIISNISRSIMFKVTDDLMRENNILPIDAGVYESPGFLVMGYYTKKEERL